MITMKKLILSFIALALIGGLATLPIAAQNVSGGTGSFTTLSTSSNVTNTKTITSATPATERLVYTTLTVDTAGNTFNIGTSSGSLAGIRGEANIAASEAFTGGFIYGVQGKSILNGSIAETSAARLTSVLGQTDLASGTVTLGQVSAGWFDLQGNPTLTVNDQVYVGRFTNSMSSGKKAQAFQLMYGAADLLIEASADGGTADWFDAASGTGAGECAQSGGIVATQTLQINVMGTNYWIPLCTAP
jgi:hypothetical protein